MVENGSSGGAGPLPPSESHDEFLELCAIATSGTLSAAERTRLAKHLSECADCRAMMAQYEALIGKVIPALATEATSENASDGSADWSLEEAEASLFARLDAGQEPASSDAAKEPEAPPSVTQVPAKHPFAGDLLWRHVWWQFAAGLLLLAALGFSIYRVGIQRGVESGRQTSPALPPASSVFPPHSNERENNFHPGDGDEEQKNVRVAALQSQLNLKSEEIARLTAQQAQLEKDLADREAERTRIAQEKRTSHSN